MALLLKLQSTAESDLLPGKSASNLKSLKMLRKSTTSPDMLVNEIRKLEMRQRQLRDEANRALELLHKDLGNQETAETIAKMLPEIKAIHATSFTPEDFEVKEKATLREEIARLNSYEKDITILEEKMENVQRYIDKLLTQLPNGKETPDSKTSSLRKKKGLPFGLSNAANMPNILRSPCSPKSSCQLTENGIENRALVIQRQHGTPSGENSGGISSREKATPRKQSISVKKMQKMFKKATEDIIGSIKAYVTELKERVAKLQCQKQLRLPGTGVGGGQ